MRIDSIAQALDMLSITQRTIASRVGVDQSQISRKSEMAWSNLHSIFVIKIFEGICEELGRGKFTITRTSDGRVRNVYYEDAEEGQVVLRPYRPNEC